MNEVLLREEKNIKDLIYEIRGKQVMLDSDLAILYGCKNGTKDINKAVKRNIERFPDDFYFQLVKEEFENLRFQFETTKSKGDLRFQFGTAKSRTLPHVFTEQGVSMLSSVLRTETASKVSVNIMRAFVSMRHYLNTNLIEQKYINKLVLEDHERLDLIFSKFDKDSEYLYLPGQIYDAYSKVLDIFKESKKELIIIDSYADKNLLDIIKELKVKVIIITKENNKLSKLNIEKYNKQYNNLKVMYDDTFHDRYFILDNKTIYHCGASINGIGKKTFSINKIEEDIIKETLLNSIKNIL